MSFRLFVLFIVLSAGGPMALAQKAAPPMSPIQQSQQGTDPRVTSLQLDIFEKAMGALPACGDNCPEYALKQASWVNSWSCIAKACSPGGDNRAMHCLQYFSGPLEASQLEKGDDLICQMVKSPGIATRQALMRAFPGSKEDGFVEGMAYVYAFEGNVSACQEQIKSYVGPYGPAWTVQWYTDMSGCRILTQKRTRQEEERDFSLWLGKNCSNIADPEMRQACSTPGTAFPM